MAHVVTDIDTTVSPERVIGALTDFSPRRFDLWPNSDRNYFKLGTVGEQSAEVTEGSPAFGGIWERGRYDWSQPGTVRIDVQDSNAFRPGSFWVYQVTPDAHGGSHVHMEFERRPRNLKGLLAAAVLTLVGGRFFTKSLRQTLSRLEKSA
jgi:polyketide cyclase/dehydrase/lipid transport protein